MNLLARQWRAHIRSPERRRNANGWSCFMICRFSYLYFSCCIEVGLQICVTMSEVTHVLGIQPETLVLAH
ncbi:rCG56902 [Rattus norvegicus]|uniref:RCG56902 n=1 Tax=Rattus norvegicus TaxID=10116 RepID=A6JD02_RAT|nr:rCG56902 [Rattus norvegicus]